MEISMKDIEFPQKIKKSLENVIKTEGFVSFKIESQEANAAGTSFLSDSSTITVKGKTKYGNKEVFLFVKKILEIGKMAAYINLPQAYLNEAFMYNKLAQVFAELQDEACIPPSERFKTIKSYGESDSEAIILENVVIQGYKSYGRTYKISLDFAERALKELAKFHALSFVLQSKKPDYFEKKVKTLQHPFTFDQGWAESATHIAKTALRHLRGDSREKLEKFLPNYAERWREYMLDQTSKSCLCHGDFRVGNLLMKHNGNKLEDLYMVDFQTMTYGSPLNDVIFFLFLDSDNKFRRQYLDQLVNFYYERFRDFLGRFNMDSEEVYPKKEFIDDLRRKLDYGLMTVLYFLPFFLADTNSIPDMTKQDLREVYIEMLEEFPERIQGIVEDFVEWGYL